MQRRFLQLAIEYWKWELPWSVSTLFDYPSVIFPFNSMKLCCLAIKLHHSFMMIGLHSITLIFFAHQLSCLRDTSAPLLQWITWLLKQTDRLRHPRLFRRLAEANHRNSSTRAREMWECDTSWNWLFGIHRYEATPRQFPIILCCLR